MSDCIPHLYVDITAANLNYSRQSLQLTCIVRGGLVSSVQWTKNNIPIITGTTFIEADPVIDRLAVSTINVLSGSYASNFVGTFECSVTDGNGRTSNSGPLLINGKQLVNKLLRVTYKLAFRLRLGAMNIA